MCLATLADYDAANGTDYYGACSAADCTGGVGGSCDGEVVPFLSDECGFYAYQYIEGNCPDQCSGGSDDGGAGCPEGTVEDCSGDGDCCAESWIGDGFEDCEDQAFGCDLTCYDNDGGDCAAGDDGSADDGGGSEDCASCEFDWSNYGSECCDTAWAEFGIDCATLESVYGWDCTGCACPGDAAAVCGDGVCSGDETCETCEVDCGVCGECEEGFVLDCADFDCCPESWIGDGFLDCEDQAFGCDLTCYDNDGGDCYVAPTCEEQGLVECPDGVCANSLDECPDLDCTMAGGNSSWLGDAFCDTVNNIPECGFDSGDCCPGECAASEAAGCPDNPTGCWSTISCGDCETCIDESSPDLADGGECSEFQVPGCTDASACNYNEEAQVDDGTCFYAGEQEDGSVVLTDCDGTCFDSSLLSWIGDGWCDDGAFGVDFVCAEYDCDGADCGDAAGDAGECGGTACLAGDVNGDDTANVQDIVLIVGYILDGVAEFDLACADMNGDGLVNVQDVVLIVGGILDGRTTSDATDAKLNINDGFVSLKANGFIGAVQMTLSHDAGFAINLTDKAMVADYRTNVNSTTLIVIAPEGDYRFDAICEFTLGEGMGYNSDA